jgi:hypothetical protein
MLTPRASFLRAFLANGIAYDPSDRSRSELYLELLCAVNAGQALLTDVPELLRELRGLERRRGTSGVGAVASRSDTTPPRINRQATLTRPPGCQPELRVPGIRVRQGLLEEDGTEAESPRRGGHVMELELQAGGGER